MKLSTFGSSFQTQHLMRSRMKIVFAFSLSLFVFNKPSHSQSYIPMPDSNAYWLITDAMIWELFVTDSVKNDTLINSTNYTKLFYLTGSWSNPMYNYVGGYRNDTAGKKVFYVPPDSTQEFLLYDFSINAGDTVSIIHRIPWPPLPFTFQMVDLVVDSVTYKTIGPRNHRRIYLHDITGLITPLAIWMEGIGGDLSGILPYTGWNYYLSCMSYNDTVYFCNGSTTCNSYFPGRCDTFTYPQNVNETLFLSDVQIFPSIVNSTVTINSSNLNLFPMGIKIYNYLGVLCKSYIVKENSSLNITELPSGSYLLHIESNTKTIKSQKIIKQ